MKMKNLKHKFLCYKFTFEVWIKTQIIKFIIKHFNVLHILYCYDYDNTLEHFAKAFFIEYAEAYNIKINDNIKNDNDVLLETIENIIY